jgi:hypothetical protein
MFGRFLGWRTVMHMDSERQTSNFEINAQTLISVEAKILPFIVHKVSVAAMHSLTTIGVFT